MRLYGKIRLQQSKKIYFFDNKVAFMRLRRRGADVSICIDCKRGANECEWLFKLKKVKGWEAKKVRNKDFVTYDVMKCPNFQKNRLSKRKRRTKEQMKLDRLER